MSKASSVVLNKLASLKPAAAKVSAAKQEQEAAQLWINVGYPVQVEMEDGTVVEEFVNLNLGIPLDRIQHRPVNSNNANFNALMAAKNNLLDQLLAMAEDVGAGQSVRLPLEVELRRVKDPEAVVKVSDAENPYLRSIL